MLRITRQTDYGILMLSHMAARATTDPFAARDLATWSGLSVPMVSKILKPLARAGIVESHRGAKGGYTLARPAESITVGEIVEALEGPIGMTTCVSHPGTCEQEGACPTQVNWERISEAVRGALEHIPLSDMVGPVPLRLVATAGDARESGLLTIG